MSARLLQLGAEVLGWEWTRYDGEAWCVVDDQQGAWCWVDKRAHAFPVYMAEELMRSIPLQCYQQRQEYSRALLEMGGAGTHFAPAPLRIAAALIAKHCITLDEARSLLEVSR